MGIVVAIDGPAGAGKSTVADAVARRCGLTLVDTGAIYRTLALQARITGTAEDDAEGLAALARVLPIAFEDRGEQRHVLLSGEDISEDIRTLEISQSASTVSKHPPVRDALLDLQRHLGRQGEGSVLEGRDIGTVVFPDADVKVFLSATPEERARRRARQLDEKGQAFPFATVLQQIKDRDKQDTEREVAPLRPAENATIIDSSELTQAEVINCICELVLDAAPELAATPGDDDADQVIA
jgi:cytidylate kinase